MADLRQLTLHGAVRDETFRAEPRTGSLSLPIPARSTNSARCGPSGAPPAGTARCSHAGPENPYLSSSAPGYCRSSGLRTAFFRPLRIDPCLAA